MRRFEDNLGGILSVIDHAHNKDKVIGSESVNNKIDKIYDNKRELVKHWETQSRELDSFRTTMEEYLKGELDEVDLVDEVKRLYNRETVK